MKFSFVQSRWFWELALGSIEHQGRIDEAGVGRAAQEHGLDPSFVRDCAYAGQTAMMGALLQVGLSEEAGSAELLFHEEVVSAELLLPWQLVKARLASPAEALELFDESAKKFRGSPKIDELRKKLETSAPA